MAQDSVVSTLRAVGHSRRCAGCRHARGRTPRRFSSTANRREHCVDTGGGCIVCAPYGGHKGHAMSSLGSDSTIQSNAAPYSGYPRPPWSVPESVFLSLCSGCGGCRDECPRGLLQKDAQGFPFIDFSKGSCDFCGDCVDACGSGALTRRYHGMSWRAWPFKAYVVGDCFGRHGVICRQCADYCCAHAITTVWEDAPRIDAQRCNGCGACLSACPADAIALCEPVAV